MIRRPPENLAALNETSLLWWIKRTEADLNIELERVSKADPRFGRVLRDAMRVEDECQRRAK